MYRTHPSDNIRAKKGLNIIISSREGLRPPWLVKTQRSPKIIKQLGRPSEIDNMWHQAVKKSVKKCQKIYSLLGLQCCGSYLSVISITVICWWKKISNRELAFAAMVKQGNALVCTRLVCTWANERPSFQLLIKGDLWTCDIICNLCILKTVPWKVRRLAVDIYWTAKETSWF